MWHRHLRVNLPADKTPDKCEMRCRSGYDTFCWYYVFAPAALPGTSSNAPLFVSHNLACNYAAGTRIKTLHELLYVCVCMFLFVCVCVLRVQCVCPVPGYVLCQAEIWIRFWIPRFLLHQHLMAVCARNLAVKRLNLDSRELCLILIWLVLGYY